MSLKLVISKSEFQILGKGKIFTVIGKFPLPHLNYDTTFNYFTVTGKYFPHLNYDTTFNYSAIEGLNINKHQLIHKNLSCLTLSHTIPDCSNMRKAFENMVETNVFFSVHSKVVYFTSLSSTWSQLVPLSSEPQNS